MSERIAISREMAKLFNVNTHAWINCDGRGVAHGEDLGYRANNLDIARLRLSAAINGWVYTAGKQFCPDCFSRLTTNHQPGDAKT